MSFVRPQRISRRALVLVILAGAFFVIARATGSGWIVVLLCGLLALLVAGVAAPTIGLCAAQISASATRDATVGRTAPLRIRVGRGRGLRLRVVDPPGDWLVADAPAEGEVLVTPARRGVFDVIEVDLTSASPLGLVGWRRRLRVALPEPIEVAPRPLEVSLAQATPAIATGTEASSRGRLGHESVRSVREYVPGDPIKLVHWASTARWGELMVKELETSDAPQLAIVVDLRGPEDLAEQAASRAAGLARTALQSRFTVTMLTAERAGPVTAGVTTAAEAGRRLARAVATPPAEGPIPPGSAVVRMTAIDGPEESGGRERR